MFLRGIEALDRHPPIGKSTLAGEPDRFSVEEMFLLAEDFGAFPT